MNILEAIAQLQALADINPRLVLVTKNECADEGITFHTVSEIGPTGIVQEFAFPHVYPLETKHAKVVMIQ